MAVDERSDVRRILEELQDRLRPASQRAWAIQRLEEMFRAGRTPDPPPEGFLKGRLVTTAISDGVDAFGRKISEMWMPWLGKSFDPSTDSGVNVLVKSARGPMRVVWPNYVPERELADRIEAFPFRTRVAPGELDPEVSVLKIDYNIEANPNLLIRRILDELVQIDDGIYLGKVLLRRQGAFKSIGFFSLER